MSDVTIVLSKHEVVVDRLFAEDVWELAFGDNAFENGYTDEDVLYTLKGYERKALAWDTMWEEHQPNEDDEDTQEDYDLREKMETYLGSCTHD
jgi:hypothetical protein|tara:strand:+ start:312 stop:590 length:279 start_codon:yes stop_codon:yes gene_type:complete